MTFMVTEEDPSSGKSLRAVVFNQVELAKGDVFTAALPEYAPEDYDLLDEPTSSAYTLYDPAGRLLSPDLDGGVDEATFSVKAASSDTSLGTVVGSKTLYMGQRAVVVALAGENAQFDGWCENEAKIEDAGSIYEFSVQSDRELIAQFSLKVEPVPPEEPSPSPVPTEEPSPSPVPAEEPSPSPVPPGEPSLSPVPLDEPSPSPVSSGEPSLSPVPSGEPIPPIEPTPTLGAKATEVPAATSTPIPVRTSTPTPAKIPTPDRTPTPTKTATPTKTLTPTRTPTPSTAPSSSGSSSGSSAQPTSAPSGGAAKTPTPTQPPADSPEEALHKLGLLAGTGAGPDGKPDFDLDKKLTRLESLALVIRLMGLEKEAQEFTGANPFSDVPAWGDKYAGYGFSKGITAGINKEHTLFASDRQVTFQEFTAFLLRVLGYSEVNGDFAYEFAIRKADEIKLFTPYELREISSENFLRGNAVLEMVDMLQTNPKGSEELQIYVLAGKGAFTQEDAKEFMKSIKKLQEERNS
jgi:hypothetical protein